MERKEGGEKGLPLVDEETGRRVWGSGMKRIEDGWAKLDWVVRRRRRDDNDERCSPPSRIVRRDLEEGTILHLVGRKLSTLDRRKHPEQEMGTWNWGLGT